MKQLENRIKWYEKNRKGFYKAHIEHELKRLKQLYDDAKYMENQFYIDRLIATFCEIIENQQDKLDELEWDVEQACIDLKRHEKFIALSLSPGKGFTMDEQVQKAFYFYLTQEVDKPLSSYTINDYCLRIKMLFNTFWEECEAGDVPKEIHPLKESLVLDNSLLNAYDNIQELQIYLDMKLSRNKENRNLLKVRAALNKFEEFKLSFISKS